MPPHAEPRPAIIADPYVNVTPYQLAQQQARSRDTRRTVVLTVLALLAVLTTMSATGALIYLARTGELRELLQARPTPPEVEAAAPEAEPAKPSDDRGRAPNDSEDNDLKTPSPHNTQERKIGSIVVVDVGRSVKTLKETLQTQRKLAHQQQQSMLVMVTASKCDPCRGVDNSLADERMQAALQDVRLVRVNRDVFVEELAELKIPHMVYPGFFLIDSEALPVDGIHGGEWDADIPQNIAPVLGPFVRGRYAKRRHKWAPRTGGVRL